ncbi:MAG: TonB-dependent receptor plug domain-containing protein [Mangrovibacterium sp.]|nr:TonB-dependent receptor plug domain-containing protein [Mangrovibacterium sp.]
MMRLTLILVFLLTIHVSGSVYSQQAKLSLQLSEVTVREVLRQIEEQSKFKFLLQDERLDIDKKISIAVKDGSIDAILDEVFDKAQVNYVITEKNLIIITPSRNKPTQIGQSLTITGTISDESGQPLPGVTILVKGTSKGTIADADGRFSLTGVSSDQVLVFSFIGMKTIERPVGTQSVINLIMEADAIGIEEVVAVGYGTQKKRDVIGSVSSLSTEDIQKTAPATIEATLQGMAAGVQVNSGAGIPGAPQQIKIRGVRSISSGTDPLWIVDGIPVRSAPMDNSYDGETNQSILAMLNPNDIESIHVLKDAAATSIYGSRGSNGVILVTTKSGKTGQTKVDVNIKTGVTNWTKSDIGYANNTDYLAIMNTAFQNSRASSYSVDNIIKQLDGATETMTQEEALKTNTNWADVISRTGSFYEANVAVSQGSDKSNSYLSLKYRKDEGSVRSRQQSLIDGEHGEAVCVGCEI